MSAGLILVLHWSHHVDEYDQSFLSVTMGNYLMLCMYLAY